MDLIYSFLDSRKKKVVNKTLNHDIKFLRMFFDNAVKWDYIKENLFKKIDNLPLTDSKKINSLSKAEITKIIAEIDRDVEKWFYNIFLFALYTGMRRGELAALTWSDQSSNYIDFDENLIKINKTKVKSNIRNIPIHEKIKKILLELRHLHKENGFSDDYVFRNFNGNPINATPLSISEKFKKITKRAGLEHITRFHSTRHTFVTHFVKFTKDKLLTSVYFGAYF
jgi:integrase